MLDLSGTDANGDYEISDYEAKKSAIAYSSQRAIRYYGTFSSATMQIGFRGRDGQGHFDPVEYNADGSQIVVVGRTGRVMVRVANATSSTVLYIDELFI
jgi:hypothetical protein